MTLPKRKPRERTKQVERREWPRHRRFVRSHKCCVWGCHGEPIEFAHLRLGTHTGMKQKPHDRFGISLCREHHREAHTVGENTFQAKHNMNWREIADNFVKHSPDQAMKASLKVSA